MNEKIQTDSISIFVYDSVSVAEVFVIELIIERITTWKAKSDKSKSVISVEEYRQLTNDFTSSAERIEERVQYLESFCRNIIKPELKKIYEQSKKNRT